VHRATPSEDRASSIAMRRPIPVNPSERELYQIKLRSTNRGSFRIIAIGGWYRRLKECRAVYNPRAFERQAEA